MRECSICSSVMRCTSNVFRLAFSLTQRSRTPSCSGIVIQWKKKDKCLETWDAYCLLLLSKHEAWSYPTSPTLAFPFLPDPSNILLSILPAFVSGASGPPISSAWRPAVPSSLYRKRCIQKNPECPEWWINNPCHKIRCQPNAKPVRPTKRAWKPTSLDWVKSRNQTCRAPCDATGSISRHDFTYKESWGLVPREHLSHRAATSRQHDIFGNPGQHESWQWPRLRILAAEFAHLKLDVSFSACQWYELASSTSNWRASSSFPATARQSWRRACNPKGLKTQHQLHQLIDLSWLYTMLWSISTSHSFQKDFTPNLLKSWAVRFAKIDHLPKACSVECKMRSEQQNCNIHQCIQHFS